MALKYRLVLRPDMRKDAAEGSKLYYAQVRSQNKIEFKKLCELVSGYCTATKGEVELVIDGLIYVLKEQLESGNIVQMGEFGNFHMVAGSRGTATEEEFNTSHFKKSRIVFSPGAILRDLAAKTRYEKLHFVVKEKEKDDKPTII